MSASRGGGSPFVGVVTPALRSVRMAVSQHSRGEPHHFSSNPGNHSEIAGT